MIPKIFAPLASEHSCRILCAYFYTTSQIQIARIANIPNWYFELVVFPEQRLLFEALSNAQQEIHLCVTLNTTLLDKILDARLRIKVREQFLSQD